MNYIGLYEILQITASVLLKVLVDSSFQRDLSYKRKKKKMKIGDKNWFSFPSDINNSFKPSKKGKKKRTRVELEEIKSDSNVERKQIYAEEGSQSEGTEIEVLEVEKITHQVSNSKYFMENLESINIVQSLHELKLYVSYLLERDNAMSSSFNSSSNDSSSELLSRNHK